MASHPTSEVADAERGSWAARVATHQRRLMVSLLAEGLGLEDARDVSQDAWARLWQQHQAGALESLALPGIVITQARFLARDLLRRRRASPTEHAPGHDAEAPGASAEAALASAQALARVRGVLAEVSESKREIFRLACEEGVPHAELARRVGLSTQRVKQIVWEVRVTLRAALEEPR